MRWKNFALAIFGISIPIATYQMIFSFNIPGPIYFLVVTPVYILYTLISAKRQGEKSAKKIIGIFAAIGLAISIAFSVVAPLGGQAIFNQIEEIMLYLFPSSVFWMTLDAPGGNPETSAVIGVYSMAIAVNVLLYSIYGCIFCYFVKLFSKNKGPA